MEKSRMNQDRSFYGLIAALLIVAIVAVPIGLTTSPAKPPRSPGQQLKASADKQFDLNNYTRAGETYEKAARALEAEGRPALADECRARSMTSLAFLITYPMTEKQLRQTLAESFPDVPEARQEKWIASGELENWMVDGSTHYFENVVENIKYRNLDLFQKDAKMFGAYTGAVLMFDDQVIPLAGVQADQPYVNPVTRTGTSTLKAPRDALPKTGNLRLWWPVPVVDGPQQGVKVKLISPAAFSHLPPTISSDFGLVYMDIPLDQLKGDLDATVQFEYTRSEQRFIVDPAKVGTYDPRSSDYIKYTGSNANIEITPSIRAKALEITGGEKNPYLAAKKIYYWMIHNIAYSLMPHFVLGPGRGISESVYVHENRYGDCGAQSMYFSALARSVGIPARACGGFQLFNGDFGDHFWAEFFLPDYGWVPVDTSLGQMAGYTRLSAAQKKTFEDFCFGHLDSMRCVIQKDTNLPYVPPAGDSIYFDLCAQTVVVACPTMTAQDNFDLVGEYQIHKTQ